MKDKSDIAPFIEKLMTQYSHDMNTVVHAMNAGALACISVMNAYPEGGITGTQAHKLLGFFVRKYAKMQGPITVLQWLGLLNLSNFESFGVIPKNAWAEVRQHAVELLAQDDQAKEKDVSKMTPQEKYTHQQGFLGKEQRDHLISIRDGNVPWGLRVQQ